MKIGIMGGGFAGLAAALRLAKKGHQVILFEKETRAGGLAAGFTQKGWRWPLEKAYHHLFINDTAVLRLAREVGQRVITKKPQTAVLIGDQIVPFDSPTTLLCFPYLSVLEKLRMGFFLTALKLINNYLIFEDKKALPWIRKLMGQKCTDLIWDPLFTGKFGSHKENISLTWFWARIKKRTASLSYPEGGFQSFADKIASEIVTLGGEVKLNNRVLSLGQKSNNPFVKTSGATWNFDKIIVTLPSFIFAKLTPKLPVPYQKKISTKSHLHALNLVLILKKPFMKNAYWLNITNKTFPFLVLVEHTNFMSKKAYNGSHILYIGNYLPIDHQFFKLSPKKLLQIFDPYLGKINPDYKNNLVKLFKFTGPFAQPIFTTGYRPHTFKTPLKNIYLANMDVVYPWDRGTNYAVEIGEKVADEI